MEQQKMRMIFEKVGNIRFISHLDMTRAFLRAFGRSGIKLKMSEGFSPHAKVSFPLPLSVGMESENEILDLQFAEDETKSPEEMLSLLNKNLPDGLRAKKLYAAGEKSQEIAYARYFISVPDFPRPSGLEAVFEQSVFIKKKTKKGTEKEIDITSGIKSIEFSEDDGALGITAILSASGENYLNPEFICRALKERFPDFPDYCKIKRIAALKNDLKEFI